MIESTIRNFQNGLIYIRKNPQLLFTVVLIVVIPCAFLVSSQQFLSAAKANQENLERERVGMLQDVFQSILTISLYDTQKVQKELERIAALNDDIVAFHVVERKQDVYMIIASLDSSQIGFSPEELELYKMSFLDERVSYTVPHVEHGIRFWESYRAVTSENGDAYIIYTKTSLEDIDKLFASRIRLAYQWLFGILAVVLYLVIRHVRLIDYAYLYRETKKANELKDLFTNMVAHELRAPLTAVKGYASLIQEQKDIQSQVRLDAEKITQAADRLLAIVSDLLDVARVQSGKLALQSKRTDIMKIIQTVTETMSIIARERGIALEIEGVVNPRYAVVDEKRLYQALTNLISNAIKYTKAGSIRISVEEKSNRIEIRVKDTGLGMSAEHQKQLFAPFFRIENTETSGTVGTGLGMWITKQFIERMSGSIDVESIKGVGTHVVVTLPK